MQYNCIRHKKLKIVPYSNIHPATLQVKEGYNLNKCPFHSNVQCFKFSKHY